MNIAGKKLLIVGLARSGAAAAEFAVKHGARVAINDARPESELTGAAELRTKGI